MNSVSSAGKTAPRGSYHHGDLRNALIEAAVDLARAEGPDAVVLREVSRRVGVTAAAMYRHFATYNDLLEEVKQRALAELGASIVEELARLPAEPDPAALAVQRLRACSHGYLHFAAAQPGLFAMAFCPISESMDEPVDAASQVRSAGAYVMLGSLLDDLVAVGLMDPARRPGAEVAAWSAVHGFAVLLLDGPLRHLSPEEQAVGRERTIQTVVDGLTRPVGG
jgi:AcrR family transcriptional regulator